MNNNLQSVLADEYDIEVFHEELSAGDLLSRGYRWATSEERQRFNMLFQYAPQIAKDSFYANEYAQIFEGAVEESYRVKIGPGLHLGSSHTTEGAFKGNLYDADNKLKGQADWILNDAKLDVSLAPQIAASAFNALSFATGQYFLSAINKNLSALEKGTEEIKRFLENLKDSEIKAAIDEMAEIARHIQYIQKDSERKKETLTRLSNIQNTSRKYISFSIKEVEAQKKSANDKDDSQKINDHLIAVMNTLSQYRILTDLFCQSKLLEIFLYNITDTKELILYRDELNKIVDEYIATFKGVISWINSYLDSNKTLNEKGIKQTMASVGVVVIPILVGGLGLIPSSIYAKRTVDDIMNYDRLQRKDKHIKYAQELVDAIDKYLPTVKEPVRSLSCYIEAAQRKFEIIKVGDNVYTDLPKGTYLRPIYS